MAKDFEGLTRKAESALPPEQIQEVKHKVIEDTFKIQRGLYVLRLLEDGDEDANYTEEILQRIGDLEHLIECKIIGVRQ